jgi:hypothetical protein
MRSSKVRTAPIIKCVKIIRPMDGRWLGTGPLEDSPTIVTVHRHQKRTVECFDQNCPFCENLWTTEERLFLPVLYGSPTRHGVLEVPANHLERLTGWANQFHTLRATVLECRRANGRSNGPIEWRCFPKESGIRDVSPDWKWLEELSETWRSNTRFALASIESEKLNVEDCAGCDIVTRSDV